MFTRAFATAALERAIKTFAQTLAAVLVAAGTGVLEAAWPAALSAAGMAAVVSLLTSVGSGALGSSGTPSALNAEVLPTDAADVAPGQD